MLCILINTPFLNREAVNCPTPDVKVTLMFAATDEIPNRATKEMAGDELRKERDRLAPLGKDLSAVVFCLFFTLDFFFA